MKKKYVSADIELLFISTCDIIASSVEDPGENPEGGEGEGNVSNNPGGSIGGGYDNTDWMGI